MRTERAVGAVAGGLAAGLALSAVMLLGEKLSGKPSELIELERATAAKLAVPTPTGDTTAIATEQVVTHGGHLALSALAGLAYAAAVDEDADGPVAGAAFGAAFFVIAYGSPGRRSASRRCLGASRCCAPSSTRSFTYCSV